jgi:hypothetical protein
MNTTQTAPLWTIENATACIAHYEARAAELEAAGDPLTASYNRREAAYCRGQLERLTGQYAGR